MGRRGFTEQPGQVERGNGTESRSLGPASSGITLADAITAYLAIREGAKIASSTLRKYRMFTNQLREFADSKRYFMLDQFTSADIDVVYSNWKLGARAKGKALGTLRNFFRFCAKRKWVAVDATDPKSVGPVSRI